MAWSDFSWWTLLVAAIVQMAGGMLWYGPIFGRAWMRAMNIDPDDKAKMEEMQKTAGPGYAASLIFAEVFGYVVDVLLASLPISSIFSALAAMFGLWVAFTLGNTSKAVFWGEMNPRVLVINSGFEVLFVGLVTVAAFIL